MSEEKDSKDNKNHHLTKWQDQLPPIKLPERKLARQVSRIQTIALVTKAAHDELSNNFAYSQFKALTTLDTVARLRMAFPSPPESPEIEAGLMRQTHEFLIRMQAVSEAAGLQILREQQRLPDILDNGSLRDLIEDLLFGE